MSNPTPPPPGAKNARDVRQQMLAGKRSGLEIIRQFMGWDMMPKWMRSKWFFGGSIGLMTFLILATDRVRSFAALRYYIVSFRPIFLMENPILHLLFAPSVANL
jgi:hypothetical protein